MVKDIKIHTVISGNGPLAEEFLSLPFRLYKGIDQWIPPFIKETRDILNRNHPFFDHSEGEFFIAERDGRCVGRIGVLNYIKLNEYRNTRGSRFYFFECEEDQEAADLLLSACEKWAAGKGLNRIVGPLGFSGMMGGGIQIDGFEHTASMTMMPWHFPYYRSLIEGAGYEKYKDFYSAHSDTVNFKLPEKVSRIAQRALGKDRFWYPRIKTKRELARYAKKVGEVYNEAWVDHEEYCPLTDRELDQLIKGLLNIADPKLIRLIFYKETLCGFVLAFPDLSEALKKCRGKIGLTDLFRIKREYKKTRKVIINGIGIHPQYQRLGGSAVLYHALTESGTPYGFQTMEMTQIAETTTQMLRDMETLGGRVYKTHRMYQKFLLSP